MAVTTAFITGAAFWLLMSAGIAKLTRPGTGSAAPWIAAQSGGRLIRRATGGVEAVAAGLLVLPETAAFGVILATGLFALFALLSLVGQARHPGEVCGCGGLMPSRRFGLTHTAVNLGLLGALAASLGVGATVGVTADSAVIFGFFVWPVLALIAVGLFMFARDSFSLPSKVEMEA